MSIINSQGGFLIGCRECDSPDCRGCNIYRLARALEQGKLDWAKDDHNGIDEEMLAAPNEEPAELFPDRNKCVRLDLGLDDCENVADFIESEFFNHMYHLLLAGDLDNVGYVRSLIRAMDALYKAAGKEPLGISYAPEVRDDV